MPLQKLTIHQPDQTSTEIPHHPWIKFIKDLNHNQWQSKDTKTNQTITATREKDQIHLEYHSDH